MRKLAFFLFLLSCFTDTYAQIGIKANNTPPIASAQLEVQSINKAFYPPRMTTQQRTTFPNLPQAGAVVYDTDLNSLFTYNGSTWVSASGATLSLPYSASQSVGGYMFNIQNTNTNTPFSTIHGTTNSLLDDAAGVTGRALNTAPTGSTYGVSGTNASTNAKGAGVSGFHNGTGVGVQGTSSSGIGGAFYSNFSYGLKTQGKLQFAGNGVGTIAADKILKSINNAGDAEWGDLVPYSNSQNSALPLIDLTNINTGNFSTMIVKSNSNASGSAIEGIATNTGITTSPRGVTGNNLSTGSSGFGVYGYHAGTGSGIGGYSLAGKGVSGASYNGYGVHGESLSNATGVYGKTGSGIGVEGFSTNNGTGISGFCSTGVGVSGNSNTGIGIYGNSNYVSGYFTSSMGYALVTDAGNVGIGTSNPAAKMDIKGSSYLSHFYYGANEDTYLRGGKAGSKVLINDVSGQGNVGIGISSPNQYLDVNGRMRIYNSAYGTAGLWFNNSTNSLNGVDGAFYGMKLDTETGIYIGNAWRFWVNSAGNGYLNGALIQTSDKRLKKNFLPLTNSLSSLNKLNGYHYYWKEENRSHDLQTGVIAQEVEKIFPELVNTDEKGFLSVNYIGLLPHLIEAVKDLTLKNEKLEARLTEIDDLKTQMNLLKAMVSKSEIVEMVNKK